MAIPDGTSVDAAECRDTQLLIIRDLMLAATQRGAWLTLGEIAGLTEFGEASISAQLRHLRKLRHGRHRVEKRRRRPRPAEDGFERRAEEGSRKRRRGEVATIWEYRVLPPGWCEESVRPDLLMPPGGEEASSVPAGVAHRVTEGCAGGCIEAAAEESHAQTGD